LKQSQVDRGKGPPGALTTAEKEELAQLRKEVRELREDREIQKISRGLLREAPEVKFAFIDAEKAFHRITKLCSVLEVSRAGFYAWCGRPLSNRAVEDARLTVLVREAHERSRRTYGSPRVHVELAEAHQVFVSRKRVIRLMQREGLKARVRKRFKRTTDSDRGQTFSPATSKRTGRTRSG
jgi:putative transposase